VVRHDLMQNTARDTLTIRNNPGPGRNYFYFSMS